MESVGSLACPSKDTVSVSKNNTIKKVSFIDDTASLECTFNKNGEGGL
jgi:hypothetical protein